MNNDPETPDTDDLTAVLAWLDQFQAIRPDGVDLLDPAAAARTAAEVARAEAENLPFDADANGFTLLLEQLARK